MLPITRYLSVLFFSITLIVAVGITTVPAHASADSCPAGYTLQVVVDPSGLGQSSACVPEGSDTGPIQSPSALANSTSTIPSPSGPTSCEGFFSSIKSPGTCIARALFAGIASFLIFIGVECLTASGLLFEAILKYTVINFQTPMYTSVQDAVNNAWTVFRDISNILIIGFFTFIAISTILGISEYGAKKLLSRVLIVAVLINFSLLFTKLVIDGSNFTAFQFYSASVAKVDDPNSAAVSTGGVATVQSKGIAGTFIQYLGVTGFADSYAAVRSAQEANDDASTGLVIGVLSFIFLISTALVFLYGSFILAARAILFIVLLITSSLAFATYLIPKLSDNYGWSKWWGSLLQNAILAPILMMMLWVTLSVSAGVSATMGGKGTLGALAQNPTAAGNISALLSFVIILGLLFASFKLSSKFSSGIGGFNFAAMVPGLGLAMGARFAGAVGRQTIGRGSALLGDRLQKASQKEGRSLVASRLFDFGAQKAKGVAKSDFNAMRSPLGAAVAAGSGMKVDSLAGRKVGGFLGGEEAKAKAAAEQARRINPKKEDHAENTKQVSMDQVRGSASLSKQHDEAVANHENKQSQATEMGAALVTLNEKHNKEMKELETTLAEAAQAGNTQGVEAAKTNISRRAAEHKTAIDEQTNRIKAANDAVQRAKNEIDNVVKSGTELAKAKGLVTDYKDRTNELAAAIATSKFTNVLYSNQENARLAHLAEHEVGHQKKKKEFEESGGADFIRGLVKAEIPAEQPAQGAAPAAQAGHDAPSPAASGGGDDHGHGPAH